MRLDDWFLTCEERDNAFSNIDNRHQPSCSWSEGNTVRPLVDGATYFTHLARALADLKRGDQLRFTDWRSDEDERLDDEDSSLGELVSAACQRGCDVRCLLWRSHSDRLAFNAKENQRFALEVNRSGGEVVLDERVRRGGSHHQKLVLFRHPTSARDDIAFVGGIDLCHGRHDDTRHHGDQQIIALDQRYGARPAWHDVQLEIRGPAIDGLDETFRERWDDPTPLNHGGRAPALFSRFTRHERHASPLPAPLSEPPADGRHAVQILRTYPARHLRYPFATPSLPRANAVWREVTPRPSNAHAP